MTNQQQSTFLFFAIILSVVILPSSLSANEKKDQAALVGAELSTIADHVSLRPKTVLDFTKASGQYCYFSATFFPRVSSTHTMVPSGISPSW